jgi:hypothetical protein
MPTDGVSTVRGTVRVPESEVSCSGPIQVKTGRPTTNNFIEPRPELAPIHHQHSDSRSGGSGCSKVITAALSQAPLRSGLRFSVLILILGNLSRSLACPSIHPSPVCHLPSVTEHHRQTKISGGIITAASGYLTSAAPESIPSVAQHQSTVGIGSPSPSYSPRHHHRTLPPHT